MEMRPAAVTQDEAEIVFRDVSRQFTTREGDQLTALDRVNLKIETGEFVSLVGPSGCGKTTLLRILAGLLSPSEGTVTFNKVPVVKPRDNVGIVFQQPLLLPWLNVLSNVLLPVDVQGRKRALYERRAHELINMIGLENFKSRLPAELSGGMQQRVALARALVHDPSFLLMDEPFAALDAMTREMMNIELQRIWAADKKTVLFVTHGIAEAVFLSDRVVVMTPRPGKIAAIVDVPFARPRSASLLGEPEFGFLVAHIRSMFGHDNKRASEPAQLLA